MSARSARCSLDELESHAAQGLPEERFPEQSGGSARVVFRSPDGPLTEVDQAAAVAATLAKLNRDECSAAVEQALASAGDAGEVRANLGAALAP
jgi:hypothetical protein